MSSLVVSVVGYVTASDKCVDHRLTYVVWPCIEAIAFISSAINPWIYCFRNSEFREVLHCNCDFRRPWVTLDPNRNMERLKSIKYSH